MEKIKQNEKNADRRALVPPRAPIRRSTPVQRLDSRLVSPEAPIVNAARPDSLLLLPPLDSRAPPPCRPKAAAAAEAQAGRASGAGPVRAADLKGRSRRDAGEGT